jgi:hypothetical protein
VQNYGRHQQKNNTDNTDNIVNIVYNINSLEDVSQELQTFILGLCDSGVKIDPGNIAPSLLDELSLNVLCAIADQHIKDHDPNQSFDVISDLLSNTISKSRDLLKKISRHK